MKKSLYWMIGTLTTLNLKKKCLSKSRKFDEQANLYSIEVVHSQNGATLIFITQEAKSFGFSSFLVSDKIYVHYLAIPVGIKKLLPLIFTLNVVDWKTTEQLKTTC